MKWQACIVIASLVAGCASSGQVGTTTMTAADVPVSAPETPPASRPESIEAREEPARPAGDLVCRAKTENGTAELYLTWEGSTAKGTLRTLAPSGLVTEKTVRAQRDKGLIVAHDIWEDDILVHSAVVSDANGKKHIRLNDWNSAASCE